MTIKILLISLLGVSLSGCFSNEPKEKTGDSEKKLGELTINYYADKSVNSLEVPPDLTSPDYQKAFRISQYAKNIDENMVNFKEVKVEEKVLNFSKKSDITVQRSGQKRWLLINKSPENVWNLVNEFFKQTGFTINKSDKKIGILETDFLENRPKVPGQSMNFIRAWLQSIGQAYTLPTVDKFRVRIEALDQGNKAELYLTLSSMEEVVNGLKGETIWQNKAKDINLENEMLLRIMMFIGDEKATAIEKILNAKDEDSKNAITVNLLEGINGYSKLVFNSDFLTTWDALNWSLDQINANVVDKDLQEKAIYIKEIRTSDQGVFTRLFGGEAVSMNFQLSVKSISNKSTEVYFNDISEENETETKQYSFDLFKEISKNL